MSLSFKILLLSTCLSMIIFVGKTRSQNCYFEEIPDGVTVVDIDNISETTSEGEILWTSYTENVTGGTASVSPYNKYVGGLRYSNHYDYVAKDIFQDFITVERLLEMERHVVYECEDGGLREITFVFKVVDENTEAPEFVNDNGDNVESLSFDYLMSSGSDVVNSRAVLIKDQDLVVENAEVVGNSTHSVFAVDLTYENNNSAHIYAVQLRILKEDANVGEYNFLLSATDGVHQASIPVTVAVNL